MKWVRRKKLKNTGCKVGENGVLSARSFTPKGGGYPRITICLREGREGFSLECSAKDMPSGHWYSRGIPEGLLDQAEIVFQEGRRAHAGSSGGEQESPGET